MNIDPSALISPHYPMGIINPVSASLEDRIALFEDRVRGYYTTPARLLDRMYENSVYLVLLAVSVCIEWLEIFYRGESSKGKSKPFFMSGFRRIFGPIRPDAVPEDQFDKDLDNILKELYDQLRCGLVHTGTTRSKILITKQIETPVKVDFNTSTNRVESIRINPYLSVLSIEFYLSEYCAKLRDIENIELRQKFDQAWEDLEDEE